MTRTTMGVDNWIYITISFSVMTLGCLATATTMTPEPVEPQTSVIMLVVTTQTSDVEVTATAQISNSVQQTNDKASELSTLSTVTKPEYTRETTEKDPALSTAVNGSNAQENITTNQPDYNTGIGDTTRNDNTFMETTTVDLLDGWRGQGEECVAYLISVPDLQYLFLTLEYLCVCFNTNCKETKAPETTTIDLLDGWRGRGEECVAYLISVPDLQYLFPTLEYLCVCFNTNCKETKAPETTTIDLLDGWRGRGEECVAYLISVPDLQYLFPTLEYLCVCFNTNCKETEAPETTTVDLLDGWRGRGEECVTYLISVPDLQYLFPTLEYLCVCFNTNCPETEAPDNSTTTYNISDQTTSMWFGKGKECLDRVFGVYELDLTREEYLCLCYDLCTEEEIEKHNADTTEPVRGKVELAILGILYALIIVCGLFGNILVIVTVVVFMSKTTVTNIYICNLAVADLLVVLICVPFKIAETMRGEWLGSEPGCKMAAWLYFCFFMSSVFTLTCMSVERFLVICYPMYSHIISSVRRTTVVIILCWIFAVGLSAPAYYVVNIDLLSGYCIADRTPDGYKKRSGFYIYVFVVIFVLPVAVMTFAYVRTIVTLWTSIKRLRQMKGQNTVTKNGNGKSEKTKISSSGRVQVIRVLILVLVVFIICWAPYLVLQLVHNTTKVLFTHTAYNIGKASTWLNLLSLANSCLNPIVYGLLSRTYREGFLRCLRCKRPSTKRGSSVLTAMSSASGSVKKNKRSSSNGSVSTNGGISNGVAMTSVVARNKIEKENESNSSGTVHKAFEMEDSSCMMEQSEAIGVGINKAFDSQESSYTIEESDTTGDVVNKAFDSEDALCVINNSDDTDGLYKINSKMEKSAEIVVEEKGTGLGRHETIEETKEDKAIPQYQTVQAAKQDKEVSQCQTLQGAKEDKEVAQCEGLDPYESEI